MKVDRSVSGKVAIAGIGQSPYARRSERDIKSLILEAVTAAVTDAGLQLSDVDGVVSESGVVPDLMNANDVATNLGLGPDTFIAHTGATGAGTAATPLLAAAAIEAGLASTIVCYFGVNWGSATGGPYAFHGADPYKASLEMPYGFFGQPVYFGAVAQRYMHEYKLTAEQLAAVAVATRQWAILNPSATMRKPLDLDGYFESPMIADPLRVLDCCLISDGAAAFVMTSAERAEDLAHQPVVVAGCANSSSRYSSHSYLSQHDDFLCTQARETGPRAFGMAGLTPADVDVAEIYDCFTVTCLMQLEDLGFCDKGEAGAFFEEGNTAPGGRLPVNTHGGLLSEAYILGINHVIEAVRQLRHHGGPRQVADAEVGLVSGYSGWEQTTLLLTRGSR